MSDAQSDLIARLEARVLELEAFVLWIVETDHHYRAPPKPKPDGGMRGWAGHNAVRVLTGQHGSYVTDEQVRQALKARTAPSHSLAGDEGDSRSEHNDR